MKVNINYIFIFLIFVELLFLFFNSNELFKEKIDYIISPEGNVGIKILSIILLILFILAIYYLTKYINKRLFIDKIILFIFYLIDQIFDFLLCIFINQLFKFIGCNSEKLFANLVRKNSINILSKILNFSSENKLSLRILNNHAAFFTSVSINSIL
jgi:hypothetical protein